VVVLLIIWYTNHTVIVKFVFLLDVLQLKALLFFWEDKDLSKLLFLVQTLDPSDVKLNTLVFVNQLIGEYTCYVFSVCLIFIGWLLYHHNVAGRFRKTYSMKTLSAQEQVNWSAIMPVMGKDLVKEDISVGPWAMALLPMEFARKYNLLKKEDRVLDKNIPGLEMTAGVRRAEAKRVFTLQLGPYWEGFQNCSPHVVGLAAIFIARINRDRTTAKNLLDEFNQNFANNKISFTSAYPVIKKYAATPLVQEITQVHAYVLTVMASLLIEARKDGVLASAEFLWLKVVDRRLWYMLNCVGRQTPYSEIGGPFAHWKAELAMKRRCRVPMIDEAIRGLEVAIKAVKLNPKQMQELKP
jgi:intracellular multiplication protein IcmP